MIPLFVAHKMPERTPIKSDLPSILLLLFLYILQGLPLGIIAAIPLLLQERRELSYSEQAILSCTWYPYCFKLIWAPVVDACWSKRVGRRKSWVVPCLYVIGGFLIAASRWVKAMMEEAESENE